MAEPTDAVVVPARAGFDTKGATLRGYVTVLARRGLLDAVRAAVPADVRARMDEPPASSEWIDARYTVAVLDALAAVRGPAVVRGFSREALEASVVPVVRTLAESLVRLFGTSPATLYARLGRLTGSNLRGVEWSYAPVAPTSGVVHMRFPAARQVSAATFSAFAGALEIPLALCGAEGTVSDAEVVTDGRDNAALYRVAWS